MKQITREEYDKENGINNCCCMYCSPGDEAPVDDCYPYRFCGSGEIIYKKSPFIKSVAFSRNKNPSHYDVDFEKLVGEYSEL